MTKGANFEVLVSDQRNIVEVSEETPNVVQVLTSNIPSSAVLFGVGAPWTIEIEIEV